jgi:amidase
VDDGRLGTRVMAQPDPRAPWWVPVPFDGAPLAQPIRAAVTRQGHGYPLHPGLVAVIECAARYLSAAGYAIVEVAPPSLMAPARGWCTVLVTEMQGTRGPTVAQHGSDDIQRIFGWYYELGPLLDLAGYRDGLADRTRLLRAWSLDLDQYPLVLTPFLLRATYPWDYDARSAAAQGARRRVDLQLRHPLPRFARGRAARGATLP